MKYKNAKQQIWWVIFAESHLFKLNFFEVILMNLILHFLGVLYLSYPLRKSKSEGKANTCGDAAEMILVFKSSS